MALVSGVYGALGLMGGLYLNLFLHGSLDPNTSSLLGALLGILFGAWFERDPPVSNSDDGAAGNSPASRDQRRLDE